MTGGDAVPSAAAASAYERAATSLLCDCGCHPQSVKECACSRADHLRAALMDEALSGKSGDAIIAGYVARQGQKILVAPPASGFNLVAWTGPAIGLLGTTILIVLMIRRWQRAHAMLAAEPIPAVPAEDDAYLARLRRDLEDSR
jgi:cytochrome c-type biogenesis protein CcmH/NrfF